MIIKIDTDANKILLGEEGQEQELSLYSKEGFECLSRLWNKVGWNERYVYTFSWMGRPVIQLPEDMIRIQEVIYRLKPDVIVETGVAHGGSLIYYASLFQAMGKGRVIGIDIEIRPHNRSAIEAHELFEYITLLEGSSTDPSILQQVEEQIRPGETVLVILDSDHSRKHVLDELESYHSLVTPGSYIVATDGFMQDLYDVPRGQANWDTDNPVEAVKVFLKDHPDFAYEQPAWPFNESELSENITHWPMAWLKKVDTEADR